MSNTLTDMQRAVRETPPRFWINNPTGEELPLALAEGALSGTTNPAYGANLLQREIQYITPIIDDVVARHDSDLEAADVVYQRISARFMEAFLPLFHRTQERSGWVTMQDDPCRDHEAALILEASERHACVGRNDMAKIPVVATGMEAIAELVRRDVPICATECFSIAQMAALCELYEQVSAACGRKPPFFLTHITGIFDEELAQQAADARLAVAPDLLQQAGTIIARKRL